MNNFAVNWNPVFETGYFNIYKQHKHLFELIQDFSTTYLLKERKESVTKILFQLEDYVKNHFTDEEKLLSKTEGFPTENHFINIFSRV